MHKFKVFSIAAFCAAMSLAAVSYAQGQLPAPVDEVEPASESLPAAESVPAAESLPAAESVPAAESLPAAESVPAAESMPAAETSIAIAKEALYPEGIEYNPQTGHFLLSSVREGTIYEIDADGAYSPFIEDERLVSTTGIHIDPVNNRLLVPNTDHGLSLQSDPERKLKMAELGIYDLTSGEPIAYADLAALRPEMGHFANDVATDEAGNAYVTDSVSPILYKVDTMGNASVFLEDDRFTGEGFNFNGIVYHPDGYLIVAKKNEGVLFKVPVDDPANFSEIQISEQFPGADGLVLTEGNGLLVIANKVNDSVTNAVFQLKGDQRWESAVVIGSFETGDVYPTTGVVRDGSVYVVYGQLSSLGAALKAPEPVFADSFQLQKVGSVQPVSTFLLEGLMP